MPHIRDTAADLADAEPLVRVGVAREESEAAHWVEALARAGIEAAVEIADGAAVAPGRTTWSGQFFVYPVLVPERQRDRAEQVVRQRRPIGEALRDLRQQFGAVSPTFYSYLLYGDVTARFGD